jgi:phenylalanyl-tRNA synthetase alpha chain
MSLLEDLEELKAKARQSLGEVRSSEALEEWRIRYLGTKGAVKEAVRRLREVPRELKPAVGKAANELKNALQALFDARTAELSAGAKTAAPTVDVTLPGRRPKIGHLHIITQTVNEICEIFGRMGFTVAYGPEVEDERHSFDALNIPASHPARDPLDNFYIDEKTILRPQTSTVQIRVMESQDPPVRIIAPGRAYRPDTVDASHYFMFHQVEGLYVDEGVSMADLKTCLDQFCKAYFGHAVATRFRPSFFPFTEPSAEVDMSCPSCGGENAEGCSMCKGSGWKELGGCGMVDPNVLDSVGYDSEKYTGYAFGLGIERMVLQKHNVPDIRLLFESDVRFLHQF